ncbi:MAG: DNA topoisomerase I, partial [Nitrososphaerales archaeon]
ELRSAFESMEQTSGGRLADAGRTRHMLDFIYGVNLSRALSESVYRFSKRFRNLTIGRVQGPALSFVVDREMEIRTHLPTPFWLVTARFEKDGEVFRAEYEKGRVSKLAEAEEIVLSCRGRDGRVADLSNKILKQRAPAPFNLGDLQREAYRLFRFSPSFTLSIAERLYLDALISYPRTSSQKLPHSINYRKIISRLGGIGAYSLLAGDLLRGREKAGLIPNEGAMDDPAHPAIHPTGERPGRRLEGTEWKLYDLIVKRFFATFGEPALIERVLAIIEISGYRFRASGKHTVRAGWIKFYRPYASLAEVELPRLGVGEVVANKGVRSQEKFTEPPARYSEAGLLERMESEQIGTKATRAEIIKTLIGRGYVTSGRIEATDLGFAVVEFMRTYMPDIVSTEVTRDMERRLEQVEGGRADSDDVIDDAVTKLLHTLTKFKSREREVGKGLDAAIASAVSASRILGRCPLCGAGQLRIIRSRRSGKRFAGCSNYGKGCRGSMPLPQTGIIKISKRACSACKWPIVYVRFRNRRYPWRLCINIECPTKRAKKTGVGKAVAAKDSRKVRYGSN